MDQIRFTDNFKFKTTKFYPIILKNVTKMDPESLAGMMAYKTGIIDKNMKLFTHYSETNMQCFLVHEDEMPKIRKHPEKLKAATWSDIEIFRELITRMCTKGNMEPPRRIKPVYIVTKLILEALEGNETAKSNIQL